MPTRNWKNELQLPIHETRSPPTRLIPDFANDDNMTNSHRLLKRSKEIKEIERARCLLQLSPTP